MDQWNRQNDAAIKQQCKAHLLLKGKFVSHHEWFYWGIRLDILGQLKVIRYIMLCKNFEFVIIYSNIASNTRFSSKATVSLSSWSRYWRSTKNTYIGQALADVLHIYLQEVAKNWERSGARRELCSLRTLSPEWEEKQTAEAEHQDHNCIHGDSSAWHSCAQPAWSFYNTTGWINMSFFGTSPAGQSDNL